MLALWSTTYHKVIILGFSIRTVALAATLALTISVIAFFGLHSSLMMSLS